MANNNRGIGAYLPFPTFGGGQKTGGVTPVQLPASQMRFPTSSYSPVRRAAKPTTKEIIAPFLPLALEGIGSLFKKEPEPLTDAEYLDTLGGLSEDPTLEATKANRKKLAKLETYKEFGEPEEKDTFGFDDVLSMVIGSQMGRGAKDFAASSQAIRKGKETARQTTQTNRAAFLASALKDVNNLTYKTFQDTNNPDAGLKGRRQGFVSPDGASFVLNKDQTNYVNSQSLDGNWVEYREPKSLSYENYESTYQALQGKAAIRPGYFDPETGLTWVKWPDHPEANDRGFIVGGEEWVKRDPSNKDLVDTMKNPYFERLMEIDEELTTRETALGKFINVANPTLASLKKGIDDPSQSATTVVSAIATFADSALQNFEQMASLQGTRPATDFFHVSRGQKAKRLYLELKAGDDESIKQATTAWERSAGVDLKKLMGRTAYNNVSTRANFLQLAYMAAAANGQTGKTLSDKDLANHLDIVGAGKSQTPEVLYNNILRFGDRLVRGLDTETQLGIPKHGMNRYNMSEKIFQSAIGRIYTPSTTTDAKGNQTPNWLDYGSYTYTPFLDRHRGIEELEIWKTHEGTGGYYDRGALGLGYNSTESTDDDPVFQEYMKSNVENRY